MAAHQEVEFLVGATEFQIALQRHAVVALHQGVQKLVHADRLPSLEAVVEVVALHHAGHGVPAGELDHAARAQRVAPFAVVADLGFGRVQNQAGLFVIGLGVRLDLLSGQRRARAVAPGRVADHAGEVADQKDDGMAQVLELAHFVQHHGVADVDIWRGGVQAELDAQRRAAGLGLLQFLDPVSLRNEFFAAPQSHRQGMRYIRRNRGACRERGGGIGGSHRSGRNDGAWVYCRPAYATKSGRVILASHPR